MMTELGRVFPVKDENAGGNSPVKRMNFQILANTKIRTGQCSRTAFESSLNIDTQRFWLLSKADLSPSVLLGISCFLC